MFSAQIAAISPPHQSLALANSEEMFVAWIAVGIVALIVGGIAVRVSSRRVMRLSTPVVEQEFVMMETHSQPSRAPAAA